MSRMRQQVKQKQQRKRGQEKEDPAGSFHNEGHPLVCVCVCASVLITSVQTRSMQKNKLKKRAKRGRHIAFHINFSVDVGLSGYAALHHDTLTADLISFFFYTQCAQLQLLGRFSCSYISHALQIYCKSNCVCVCACESVCTGHSLTVLFPSVFLSGHAPHRTPPHTHTFLLFG